MISIAIANQKGGVGKTTTTAALGSLFCDRGYQVLIIDMDSQASLTKALGVQAESKSIADVMGSHLQGTLTLREVTQPIRDGFSMVPSNILMYTTEMGLVSRMGRETILKKAIGDLAGIDVVLIDCPPSMGMLTINGLVASQGVIIPSLPAEADLLGVRSLVETIRSIEAAGLNQEIELLGILIVQFDGRANEHNRILDSVKESSQPLLGVIPRSVRVQESVAARKPVTDYSPRCKPALAYEEVAEKVASWINHQATSSGKHQK